MAIADMIEGNGNHEPRKLTGRAVLGWVIGFFAVIFAANAVFLWLAISSFSGIEETSAYKAGQTFARDRAEASAQAERGWQVSTEIERNGAGASLSLSARDHDGAPLRGIAFTAIFLRPADDGGDHVVTMVEREAGIYRGAVEEIIDGQWMVEITGESIDPQSGEQVRLYKSRNRILIKG
ncbi:FixH family protein [Tepidamorphus sp. 3E244]|uniref:FixH family protein n=1 Tax=Tepidamorphus sp. 3E244 TaxID=3385498 RepID=UPI0038FD02E9